MAGGLDGTSRLLDVQSSPSPSTSVQHKAIGPHAETPFYSMTQLQVLARVSGWPGVGGGCWVSGVQFCAEKRREEKEGTTDKVFGVF